jgi:hypothetical protein
MEIKKWIGCDLDGTLARYDNWSGIESIGPPIWPMVNRIKKHIANGDTVKIFTARVSEGPGAIPYIHDWLEFEAGLPRLEVTNIKDLGMELLYDDRCIQIIKNTGEIVCGEDL